MEGFKSLINYISNPTILFTAILVGFPFVFPPNDWFYNVNKKLKIDKLWTKKGLFVMVAVTIVFFVFGLGDSDFRSIVLKPDNVPISGLIILLIFFTWLSMSQAYENDKLMDEGKPVDEYYEAPNDKVLVWPDLVYVELISLVLFSAFMLIWSIGLPAPIEQPANPSESPNPAKAPWYFLGLQELLSYWDPQIAGVMIPLVLGVVLWMAFPYIDRNPETHPSKRKFAIMFYTFFLAGAGVLTIIGVLFRGPGWNWTYPWIDGIWFDDLLDWIHFE